MNIHYTFLSSKQSFMAAYFRSLEDQIKRSARREGENRQKEEKRKARRERRSPNQVKQIWANVHVIFG